MPPDHFAIRNASAPRALVADPAAASGDGDLVAVDIHVRDGRIADVAAPAGVVEDGDIDLDGGQAWPCFVDVHTHLDKGHIWERTPNPDGTFMGALDNVTYDRDTFWQEDDVRLRMDFGLRCSHAHGTRAVRTHLDSPLNQAETTWGVFRELRDDWAGRIELQGVCLLLLDWFREGVGPTVADLVARSNGVLGAVTLMIPDIDDVLDDVFRLAMDRGLDLDFHVDETKDVGAVSLRHIAQAARRNGFEGRIQCGHCCSLAMQADDDIDRTLDLVAEAGISVVSLPMCNMYLQDRVPGRTPRWRGVTLLHEFAARGIPVSVASDNCRDPFYGYGDHDMVEVFTQAVRIAHLDRPVGDWPKAATATPAEVMRLDTPARIEAGQPADLVLFRARAHSELLSRPQADRVVLRDGRPIDTTLPDHRELDDLPGRHIG